MVREAETFLTDSDGPGPPVWTAEGADVTSERQMSLAVQTFKKTAQEHERQL